VNALRLIVGTLTIFPVRAPDNITTETARQAAVLAPIAGALLALASALPAWFSAVHLPPLLTATLSIGAVAFLTRAIHLDGLADTADGLASNKDRIGTLDVMRRSDIGPFAVVTLVLVLMIQVAALSACFAADIGAPALAIALVVSRASLAWLCTQPAARPDGLGVTFARTTGGGDVAATTLLALLLSLPIALLGAVISEGSPLTQWILQPLALLPAWWLVRNARRRLGGLTGDVYGAAIEATFTSSLVLAALAVSL
jgi:adenosylcobinamide-GDP ribazoletransferase